MKKMNTQLLFAAIIFLAFIACSKDNSTGGSCSVSGPIVAKWTLGSEIIDITTTEDGVISRDTSFYSNGSYANFECDGSCVEHIIFTLNGTSKTYDSTSYYSVSGNKLSFYGSKNGPLIGTDSIEILTSSSMVLYFKYVDSVHANTVEESWLTLSK
jgi:hypothetical protein